MAHRLERGYQLWPELSYMTRRQLTGRPDEQGSPTARRISNWGFPYMSTVVLGGMGKMSALRCTRLTLAARGSMRCRSSDSIRVGLTPPCDSSIQGRSYHTSFLFIPLQKPEEQNAARGNSRVVREERAYVRRYAYGCRHEGGESIDESEAEEHLVSEGGGSVLKPQGCTLKLIN